MNTVRERGLGGSVCGECGASLPVKGKNSRVCVVCFPERELVEYLDTREMDVVRKVMDAKDLSAKAVLRRFFRLGQLADHYLDKGYRLAFYNTTTLQYEDPFETGFRKAPMPDPAGSDPTFGRLEIDAAEKQIPSCGNGLCRVDKGVTFHATTCPESGPGWA